MEAVGTEAAANIISEVCKCVIGPLVQLIKDVIHLDRNTRLLQEKLTTARAFVDETASQFQRQQRDMPVDVNEGLEKLRESLEHGQGMINRSQQRQGCLDRNFCKPRVCRQIRKCSIDIEERRIHLRDVISTQGIVSLAPLQAGALLQTVPASGYLGSGMKLAEEKLNTWLEDAQFGVIGVFGMGGIGKTSLLKNVYNSHKKGNAFEKVIWLTVSQKFNILVLQSTIAKAIGLNLEISSSNAESSSAVLDMPKMRLYNYLKEKKFLLVLDDVWKPIQLEEELGIPLGNDKGSKVVISTRSRDVIREMGADDSYCIQIRPLSRDEGWLLFCTKAFKTSAAKAPTKRIEDVAIQIAEECKGLPLAINVVAAAMIGNTNADEWDLALSQMKSVDPHFRTMFGETIDEGLYKKLQWSDDILPDYLKNCFLYCGAFSEDAKIEVERLVEMWIGEGMVNSRDKRQLMDVGRRYVKQ